MKDRKIKQKELKIYCSDCKRKTIVIDVFKVEEYEDTEVFRGIGTNGCLHLLEFELPRR